MEKDPTSILIGSSNESGFILALFIFLVTLLAPFFSRELRKSQSIMFGYWFVVGLHHFAAVINAYFFSLPGAKQDALGMQIHAIRSLIYEEWSFVVGYKLYIGLLASFYRQFSASLLLGEELSILAFSFSCIIFLKINKHLGLARHKVSSLIIFGALPSVVVLGSVTLREQYQVCFILLSVYFGIKMHLKGGINCHFIGLVLSALAMGLFHKALIVYSAFLIALILAWTFHPVVRRWNIKKMHLAMIVILPILFVGLMILENTKLPGLGTLTKLTNNNWLDAIETYRYGLSSSAGRATYLVLFDNSSSILGVISLLKFYLYYMLAPFPWQITNALDAYASGESLMRLVLLSFSIYSWRRSTGVQRRQFGLMLAIYFSLTFMWALGTSNYGTAIRHHMVTYWIIVLLGVPPLIEKLGFIRFGLKRDRRLLPLEDMGIHPVDLKNRL